MDKRMKLGVPWALCLTLRILCLTYTSACPGWLMTLPRAGEPAAVPTPRQPRKTVKFGGVQFNTAFDIEVACADPHPNLAFHAAIRNEI